MIKLMAYYLAVERQPNSYEAINIKDTPKGKTIFSSYTDAYKCTLEEIDCFTTQHISLEKMTYELKNERKIPWYNSKLAIISINDIEIKIEDNMLFLESRKYIENPDKVRDYLIMKYRHSSLEFYRELFESLSEQESTRNNVEQIIEIIEGNLVSNKVPNSLEIMPIIDTLVYQLDSKGNLIIPHNYSYENLRNIILAIANYENKLKENKQSYKKTRKKYIE